jgi:single-stranded-DNA-specific exonuclease
MPARIVRYPHEPSSKSAERVPDGVTPLLWRVYRARGVDDPRELDRSLGALIPPSKMSGMDRAVDILAQALGSESKILIVGDFDADGATSCALAVLCLRAFGHQKVEFLVPNRFEFGYGLTPEIVEHARRLAPDLIVTVDNGISSLDGVAAARANGWTVVVTDHHLPGERLPDAHAIVNPNLADNDFPSKALAGVGVLFYVLLGLRARLRDTGWFTTRGIREPRMADFLDLVAVGTVADVVPLDHNNRVLVHQGLERIRAGRCRPGITALLQVGGRNPARTQATDIGFALGPRLNAAGRIDDMSLGIACLLADQPDTALDLARQLDTLNRERRSIEDGMRLQAEALLESWAPNADDTALPWGLCLYQSDWHQGVIGILASRVKERHHRPVIAFAREHDGWLKGSARSIPGLHIRDALDEVATGHPGLLNKFGGHAMAAGLSLREADFDAFAEAFDAVVRRHLGNDDLNAVVASDGEVAPGDMNLETARAILDGGPWGQAFPEPTFDGVFDVISSRVVGEKHWKLVVSPAGADVPVDAIAFNTVADMPTLPSRVQAAYKLDQNEWKGRLSLQLRMECLSEVT